MPQPPNPALLLETSNIARRFGLPTPPLSQAGRQVLSFSPSLASASPSLTPEFHTSPDSDCEGRLEAALANTGRQGHLARESFGGDTELPGPRSSPNPFNPMAHDVQMCDPDDFSGLLLEDFFPPAFGVTSDASSEYALQPRALPTPAPSTPPMTADDTTTSADSPMTTADLDAASQADDRPPENTTLRAKRTKRLQTFLESLRHAPTPTRDAHNAAVDELAAAAALDITSGPCKTPSQLAARLEKLGGDAGGARGFVYGLLSWEVFRREEERLARAERLSAIAASKAANRQMVETLHRRAKTRDWARDGRKAAKVVFDALRGRAPSERSAALLLLAGTVSLDGMLKIAHFPATRAGFAASFAAIVEGRAEVWRNLPGRGYRTFDYEALLRAKGGLRDD